MLGKRRNRRADRDDRTGGAADQAAVAAAHEADNVVTITDQTFMAETEGGYTVVDFWAPWCAPCRQFASLYHELADELGDQLKFGSINVDENPATAALLQIRSIPTLVLFDPRGNEHGRLSGVPPRAAFLELTRPALGRVR